MHIDHEYLYELYRDDPDEFERVTGQMIEDTIAKAPVERQQRYRAVQWRVDQELRKHKDPLQRMNKMVELFWSQVVKFQESINGL